MATNPRESVPLLRELLRYEKMRHRANAPRLNAILWDDGETQPVSWALPTLFRNPTMPAIAGQRCWQNLCVIVTTLAAVALW